MTTLCLLGLVRDALYIIGSPSQCKQFYPLFTHIHTTKWWMPDFGLKSPCLAAALPGVTNRLQHMPRVVGG